jgi:hypothetical protein
VFFDIAVLLYPLISLISHSQNVNKNDFTPSNKNKIRFCQAALNYESLTTRRVGFVSLLYTSGNLPVKKIKEISKSFPDGGKSNRFHWLQGSRRRLFSGGTGFAKGSEEPAVVTVTLY